MDLVCKYPYSKGEEVVNSISHGAGVLLAIAGCAIMISRSQDRIATVSAAIYGLSMILMYTMSTLYHAVPIKRAKRILQVLDHASIYLLIAGCYAPVTLVLLRDSRRGLFLLAAVWVLAAVGIILNVVDMNRFKHVGLILYLLMGWAVILDIRNIVGMLGTTGSALLIVGGVCYMVGVIFYKLKQIRYMHGIWHLFVLAGSVLHYLCILRYIILV